MTISLYDASVPVFRRYLDRLVGLVDVAESQAPALGLDEATLLGTRLAEDMLPFETQVVIAANFALRGSFPLAGQAVPPYGDFPTSFDGLRARIAHAVALLDTLEPSRFADMEMQIIESQAGRALVALPAAEFLFHYALPNFFFHITMAYALLRQRGFAIGKEDFDGWHSYAPEP